MGKLYSRSLSYVNICHTDSEINSMLQVAEQLGVSRFLVYFSAEAIEPEYEEKLMKKLISLKKSTSDSKSLAVVFTKNEAILKNIFKIIPEKHIDTVRLIDYSKEKNLTNFSDWNFLCLLSANKAPTKVDNSVIHLSE